jgi:hypothetical protein
MGWSHSKMIDCKECKTKQSNEVTYWGENCFQGESETCIECGKYEYYSWYNGEEEDWKVEYEENIEFTEGFLSLEEVNKVRENSLQIHPINTLEEVK